MSKKLKGAKKMISVSLVFMILLVANFLIPPQKLNAYQIPENRYISYGNDAQGYYVSVFDPMNPQLGLQLIRLTGAAQGCVIYSYSTQLKPWQPLLYLDGENLYVRCLRSYVPIEFVVNLQTKVWTEIPQVDTPTNPYLVDSSGYMWTDRDGSVARTNINTGETTVVMPYEYYNNYGSWSSKSYSLKGNAPDGTGMYARSQVSGGPAAYQYYHTLMLWGNGYNGAELYTAPGDFGYNGPAPVSKTMQDGIYTSNGYMACLERTDYYYSMSGNTDYVIKNQNGSRLTPVFRNTRPQYIASISNNQAVYRRQTAKDSPTWVLCRGNSGTETVITSGVGECFYDYQMNKVYFRQGYYFWSYDCTSGNVERVSTLQQHYAEQGYWGGDDDNQYWVITVPDHYEDITIRNQAIYARGRNTMRIINTAPTLDVLNEVNGKTLGGGIFSETDSSMVFQMTVSDPDNDTLTYRYFVDSEALPRASNQISNTQTPQWGSLGPLNAGTLSEGSHKLRFEVYDGTAAVQVEKDIWVDKTAPAFGTVSFSSDDASITIIGSATDTVPGLPTGMHDSPYRYTVDGISASGWVAETGRTIGGLAPNTQYTARFEARDRAGHISVREQNIYTKAQIPVLTVSNATENTLDLIFGGGNPAYTQYQISTGTGYVNAQGDITASAVWVTPANKKITVKNLTSNTAYNFLASAINQEGATTSAGSWVGGATLPPAPSGLHASSTRTSVTAAWNAVPGLPVTYQVLVDNNTGSVVNNGQSTSYTHAPLEPDTVHTYRVRAINQVGTGAWSSLLMQSTLPNPPDAPVNLRVTEVTAGEIAIAWDPAPRAAQYSVEVDGVLADNGISTTYTHVGLDAGTRHAYKVRAANPGGESGMSDVLEVWTLPAPPMGLNAIAGREGVTVTWNAVAGATGYYVKRSKGGGEILIEDNGAGLSHTDTIDDTETGLRHLTEYSYTVRAVNSSGEGDWSGEIRITTYPPVPQIPGNIIATAEKTAITLTWYRVEHADGYEIEADGTVIADSTGTTYTIAGLEPDSRHTYRVRAKNISGEGGWSKDVSASTFPEIGEGSISLTNVIAVVTNSFITISWDAVAAGASYEVEVDGIIVDAGDKTVYNHTGLAPEVYHIYKIRMKNSSGQNDWCAILSLCTLPDPPDAPSITGAAVTQNSIEIRWEASNGAVGYDVEVDGETRDNGAATSHNQTGLAPGTSHTYRVRSRNITGVSSWSTAVTKSTTSPIYTIRCAADETIDLSLLVSNVQDFTGLKFIITYNRDELDPADLFGFTPEPDINGSGTIRGSNLNVSYTPGRIEFTVKQSIAPGKSWSGELTHLLFKSKINGEASIDFWVE